MNVAGSTGPLRLVVNENDMVSDVIHITLKSFARLGRLPLLPSDPNNFLLYSSLKLHGIITYLLLLLVYYIFSYYYFSCRL